MKSIYFHLMPYDGLKEVSRVLDAAVGMPSLPESKGN